MKSGHVRRGRAWLAWALFCAGICVSGLCVRSVHAQARVVFTGFDEAELLARIRGQTRDLPVALIPAATAALSRPSAAQLQAIAEKDAAEFVVNVDQELSGARVVYVLDVRAGELRVRVAPAPQRKRRFARSAAAETVALIVRGELSDALAARASQAASQPPNAGSTPSAAADTNTPSGRAAPTTAAQRAPSSDRVTRAGSTPKPAPKVVSAPRAEPAPEDHTDEDDTSDESQERSDTQEAGATITWLVPKELSLELAGRLSTPIADRYFLGAALSLRCSFDNFSIGVTGASSLADRAHIQGLTLSLREHAIGVDALLHLSLPAGLRAGLGVTGRWLFYQRKAASDDPDWNPEPADTSSSFAVGPQVELRWQLAEHLGVGVRIGLDVLLRPVSWRYKLDTNPRVPIELERQNRSEPWLSLGVYGSL